VTTADEALGWPTRMAEVAFSLGDPDELAAQARAAGWNAVTVAVDELVLAVPPVEALIERRRRMPAMADAWETATDAERVRWRAIVEERLEPFRRSQDLGVPSRANLLTATT